MIDNPQAFPHFTPDGHYNGSVDHEGMSLRDWFAGQALAGLLQVPGERTPGESTFAGAEHLAASDAYRFADAMLAEREKRES